MNRRTRGVTLVEILIALAILAIAFIGLLATILHGSQANAVNSDTNRATRAAEQAMETMIGSVSDPADIFTAYNLNPGDNPVYIDAYNLIGGGQTGFFDVLNTGQIIFGGNPNGRPLMFQRIAAATPVGRIFFPESPNGTLNETAGTTLGLGMPRSLNNNTSTNETDVNLTYRILPCLVRLEFIGGDGTRRLVEFRKIIFIEPPPPPPPP